MKKNYLNNFIVRFVNNMANTFNLKLEYPSALYCILASYFFIYVGAGYQINLTKYSPDSWAYFELSKTIFNENFYKFNTFRSYFSVEHSTSFPFGWPIIIALTSIVVGVDPLNAAYINIVLATTSIVIIFRIGKNLSFPLISSFLICSALLFYRPYADEVFSGRSMPLAILVFLIAFYLYQRNALFLAGLFIGFSALVRFDFLVYAIIFQLIIFSMVRLEVKKYFLLVFGFLIGILPWVLYSYVKFEKFWVSDNSWVAISALPAFVLDYPAAPVVSAFNDPSAWLGRVLGNLIPLLKSIIKSAIYFPAFAVIVCFAFINFSRINFELRKKAIAFLFSGILGVVPYMLTGYFDSRYFALIFLIGLTFLIFVLNSNSDLYYFGFSLNGLSLLVIIITISFGLIFLVRDVFISQNSLVGVSNQENQINKLYLCHLMDSKKTYIFMNEVAGIAPRYGALTGMRAAFGPSNFNRMTNSEKSNYFEFMNPYVLIDGIEKVEKCANQ